jgi:REP element-mobilizing transposase RayT
MPRRLRIHAPGGFYHVTLRGNHRRAIFVEEGDQRLLNVIVARAIASFEARVHAYCWMGNHIHLLLQAGSEPISSPMRNIAAEFARAMQSKLGTTGHFFERRYHSTLVDHDSYLLQLIRYIHRNPVEAGIVTHVSAYPWSSHHAYAGSRSEGWVTVDFALRMFARHRVQAVHAYRRFLDAPRHDDEPWLATMASNGGGVQVLGNDEFVARAQGRASPLRARESLEDVIAEGCRRFAVSLDRLASTLHDPYSARVRAWIACQVVRRRVASLAAVARALGRNEATLRYAIRRYCQGSE